jgi:fructose-specific phosphotransferase system IIC component
MEFTVLQAGFFCVLVGGLLTAYHISHLLKKEGDDNWYHISMILIGGLLISMSANLFASTIHDKLKHKS